MALDQIAGGAVAEHLEAMTGAGAASPAAAASAAGAGEGAR